MCVLCIKWLRIRAAVKALRQAKLNAYNRTDLKTTKKPSRLKTCCTHIFCCCLQFKVCGTKTTAFDYLCTTGSYANRIAKGLFRFLLGLLSVAVLLHFLKNKLNLSLSEVWLYFAGILVGLGVTFSQTVRVLLLLLAPQIFTQNVRFALMTNAAYVALKGPGKNFRYNLDALMEGLHKCKVDLEKSLRDAMRLILDPLEIIADFFRTIESAIEAALQKLREAVEFVQFSASSLERVMYDAYDWLGEVTDMCNFQFGTPYHRCKQEFQEAVSDCTEKLGSSLSFMCHVDILDSLCEVTKVAESMCTLPSIIGENLFSLIRIELQEVLDTWSEFFDARIHNVTFIPPNSKLTFSKNVNFFETLKQEVFDSIDWLLRWPITLQDLLTLGIAMVMIWSSIYYLYWYLHSDQHDNTYITDGMVRMDIRRRMLGKQGIFPLNHTESKEYVQIWSLRKLKTEKSKFRHQLIMVATSIIPTVIYVFIDLTLYSLLLLIDQLGESSQNDQVFSTTAHPGDFNETSDATTENQFPKLSRRIKSLLEFDLSDCTPTPRQPNFVLDVIIGLLLLFCIVSTAFEAYGLRLRHVICGYYFPDKQLGRERWLYTHILNSRGSFFKYAKTQVMAKLTGDDHVYRVGCVQRFIDKCPGGRKLCWFLSVNQKQCFLCGKSGGIDDYDNFRHCPECKAVYCNDCFHHLKRECPVCSVQISYDVDIDEESGSTDSSDDYKNSKPRIISKMFREIRANKISKSSNEKLNSKSSYEKLSSKSSSEKLSSRLSYEKLSSRLSYEKSSSKLSYEKSSSKSSYEKSSSKLSYEKSSSKSSYKQLRTTSSSSESEEAEDTSEADLQDQHYQQTRSSVQRSLSQQHLRSHVPTSSNKKLSKQVQTFLHNEPNENQSPKTYKIFHSSGINGDSLTSSGAKEKRVQTSRRRMNQDYRHEAALTTPRTSDLSQLTEESDFLYFPQDNGGSTSERSSFKSYATSSHPDNGNSATVNEKLNNFWKVPIINDGITSWEDKSVGNSELNPAWLTNRNVEENVYSTYNSVLSDLSSSYKQFQVLSSEDLMSGIDSSASYESARSGMASMESFPKERNYDHEVGTHKKHPQGTSTAKAPHGLSEYDYNCCISREENRIDDGLKVRYEQVLLQLTSDFPQFDMKSETEIDRHSN